MTVGEFVGHLVATEAARLRRGGKPIEPTTDPAARTRYLRIASPAPDWIKLKSAATSACSLSPQFAQCLSPGRDRTGSRRWDQTPGTRPRTATRTSAGSTR